MRETFSRMLPKWLWPRRAARPGEGGSRLLRRTFVIALVLVSFGLITGGTVELYFRYLESIEDIGALQGEMAQGAAFKIQQFVQDIEKTMRATTQTRESVTEGITESFRFHLIKMMKVAPAITTAQVIDASGKGLMTASRVHLVEDKELGSYLKDEAYVEARAGRSYFGPVYFIRQSEPFMRIAVPIEWFVGEVVGVLIAEVNLKYIREVVSQIRVGDAGYAYVVSRDGDLIAHPDISLVLQKRNLKHLGQVRAALSRDRGSLPAQPNLTGGTVFPAYAAIPEVGWAVLVERPAGEAYAPLYASIIRTALLLLLGLGMAVMASVLIARRVVYPVQVLRGGAARIGAGELEHRIEIKTGDELQALAEEFNQMAAQLQESRAGLELRVEERTQELAETLEQQTAIADILGVISSSPTDLAPVFDTILEQATRLCDAELGMLVLYEQGRFKGVAFRGAKPEFSQYFEELDWFQAGPVSGLGRLEKELRAIHIPDLTADAAYHEGDPHRVATADMEGVRTLVAVPMLKERVLIGVIVIYRREVREFSGKQIALARTFADQAVIAIENVRLLEQLQARTEELGRSVEELQALGEVGQAVSSTLDLQTVLTTVVARAVHISKASGGVIYEYDEQAGVFSQRAAHQAPAELTDSLQATPIRLGEGAMGTAAKNQMPVQVPDILDERAQILPQARSVLGDAGYRSLLAVPLLVEQRIMGGLVVWRMEKGEFDEPVVNLLQTFATQSTLAIQNARLFREIEERGVELEIASRHKSQFLANMSHELRTPLNAILGYTELILDNIYGDVPEKVREVLDRVQISGKHLLGLINAVLDLSKIEAGQLSLSFNNYSMSEVVQTVFTAVESLAAEKQLALKVKVPPDLPMGHGDEQRITQVLLNLVGNAIKFTEEGSVVLEVSAANGAYLLSVSDTGPGIPEADQDSIFGEFQQADNTDTKNLGGTGLGLAIAKKFVQMHDGRIWVESVPGEGATFRVSLPVRTTISEKDHEQTNLGG